MASNTSVYFKDDLAFELDTVASELGVSRNKLITKLLAAGLDGMASSTPVCKRDVTIYKFRSTVIFEGA